MTPPTPIHAETLLELTVGRHVWPVTVPHPARVGLLRRADLTVPHSPAELLHAALAEPVGVGAAVARSVTPDDRVTVVLDEQLPAVTELLTGLLQHLGNGGIQPQNVTVLVPPGGGNGAWVEELPDEFADVVIEVHDLEDRQKVAYLATTRAGTRVYLNRTLVEADCVIVLSGRRFHPAFGHAGAEAALFPALGEPDAVAATVGRFSTKPPTEKGTSAAAEAREVARLLGTPFFIHVVEGLGETVAAVTVTLVDQSPHGADRYDEFWRVIADRPADLVIASIAGNPERVTFLDVALAAAAGARVVRPGGRVVVLTDANPALHEGAELIRQTEEPDEVPALLKSRKPDDWPAAALWLNAVRTANIFLASRLEPDVTESLFATPLRTATELQRLVTVAEAVLVIPDAHKTVVDLA